MLMEQPYENKSVAVANQNLESFDAALSWIVQRVEEFSNHMSLQIQINSWHNLPVEPNTAEENPPVTWAAQVTAVVPWEPK